MRAFFHDFFYTRHSNCCFFAVVFLTHVIKRKFALQILFSQNFKATKIKLSKAFFLSQTKITQHPSQQEKNYVKTEFFLRLVVTMVTNCASFLAMVTNLTKSSFVTLGFQVDFPKYIFQIFKKNF